MTKSSDIFQSFFSYNKPVINKKEINCLINQGFVVLKRNKKYWDSLNINIEKVKNVVEKEIENFEVKPESYRKIDHTYRYEEGTNRLSNILSKDKIFYNFINIPDVLYCVKEILGKNFRLSSLGMREPLKNAGYQGLHIDWQQRKNIKSSFFQVTAFILLDKVTKSNGALRVIPKSHYKLINISSTSSFKNKRKTEDHKLLEKEDKFNAKYITGNKGDIIILNVNAFHGGSKNINGKRRRVIVADYRISSERAQVDQDKAIPKILHANFNNFQRKILDLEEKSFIEKLKRWVYNNRRNKYISVMIKLKSLLRL